MSFNADIQTLGFGQMHEAQVEAFMQLVDAALNLAASVDDEIFDEMHQVAEDAVIMFGGVGIDVKFKADY